jgi:conjugal transfer mating pair stabilization protein TraN
MCEAIPTCSGSGVYDPLKDNCFGGFNTCPLGNQYTCMEYQGVMQCSANPCINPAAPGAVETTTLDESMLKDDARDTDGNCLGQLYIFNGKASRCRPPGLTVGMINDCCESDEAMSFFTSIHPPGFQTHSPRHGVLNWFVNVS